MEAVTDVREETLKGAALRFDALLDEIHARKPAVSLIVFDGSPGFAEVQQLPRGTFVMYSAGAGQRVIERLGENDSDVNSVYVRALLPQLKVPGLRIQEIARQVRWELMKTAKTVGHEQTPAHFDQINVDFCPAGCAAPAQGGNAKVQR